MEEDLTKKENERQPQFFGEIYNDDLKKMEVERKV